MISTTFSTTGGTGAAIAKFFLPIIAGDLKLWEGMALLDGHVDCDHQHWTVV